MIRPMPRVVTASLLCLAVGALSGQQQTERPQFRSGVDVLQLDVSVLDKTRRPVTGLSETDFTVEIGGKRVPVVAFTPVTLPAATAPAAPWMNEVAPDTVSNQLPEEGRLIVILFDHSLGFEEMDDARRIARVMVEMMAPGDLAAATYVGQAVPQNFTADRSRLLAALHQPFLGHITGGNNPSECFCGLCTLEAIEQVANSLRPVERRRKVLIFIGASIEFQGRGICFLPGKDARTRTFRALDRANVVVHALDPMGLVTGGTPAASRTVAPLGRGESGRQLNLGVLPARTGGRVVVNTNTPEEKVPDVLAESESYYVLGVERPAARSSQRDQDVKVRVNRKDVTVSSTRAYNSAGVTSASAGKPSPNDPPRSLVDALAGVWPATAIDLTMTASAFDAPRQDTATVAIIATITEPDGAPETGAPQSAVRTLNVLAGAWDRNGRPTATQTHTVEVAAAKGLAAGGRRMFEVASRLELPEGKHDVRVAVEDPITGRKGSVYTTVDVPNFDGDDLSLSDLVVGVAPAPPLAPQQTFSNLLPIVPTAVRVFSRASRAVAFVRAYQGGRDVPRDVTIKRQLVGVATTPIEDDTSSLPAALFVGTRSADYLIELPVATLTPGPYLLTLTAVRGDKTVVRRLRFEVK